MSLENLDSKQFPDPKTLDNQEYKQPSEQAPKGESEEVPEEGEEEEEGECGFCLFMKAGGCRETFVGWEDCVKEAEENNEDVAEKCYKATSALMKCMEAHADYYAPILRAEKKAEEEAVKELEEEKEKMNSKDFGEKTEMKAEEEAVKESEEEKMENSKDLGKKSDG